MKIGIITFHWAINYGAVLQCYALQETLKALGHDVFVINYKPKRFDNTFWTFIRYRMFLHPKAYYRDIKKEKKIMLFRNKYLNLTQRYFSTKELQEQCYYDCVISGSDQVLNVSFLRYGEPGGSKAYYLDFCNNKTKRVAYAVSFGAVEYPQDAIESLKEVVSRFSAISVRENTGVAIFKAMGRDDVTVVPDPTLLLDKELYMRLLKPIKKEKKICLYMLHRRERYVDGLCNIEYITNNGGGIETWLSLIYSAKGVITNSFHGTIFSILFHVPFLVVLKTMNNVGMNDRFFSMLYRLNLSNRITTEKCCNFSILDEPIDWNIVDKKLKKYQKEGFDYLSFLQ